MTLKNVVVIVFKRKKNQKYFFLQHTFKKESNNNKSDASAISISTYKPTRGARNAVIIKFNVHPSAISRLWKQGKMSKTNSDEIFNVSLQKVVNLAKRKEKSSLV